jgi:L-serine/L-threonine ammonia-lyase
MPLHCITPTIKHEALSIELNKNIWLKMDCYQPVLSFKIRGIGHLCEQAKQQGYTDLVAVSGGNAGYAAAYAGLHLGMSATVFMPAHISGVTKQKLMQLGANVEQVGDSFDDAYIAANAYIAKHKAFFVHPFDHADIWTGHSTLVDELVHQVTQPLSTANINKPQAIVLSVGGGGLMCGVIQGLIKHGWGDVKIIAVETQGTNSLETSAQQKSLVTLDKTSGIATSLAAKKVAQQAFDYSQNYDVTCISVSDEDALQACVKFSHDKNVLVEPACGATLAIAYSQKYQYLLDGMQDILFVVCGGINTHYIKTTA